MGLYVVPDIPIPSPECVSALYWGPLIVYVLYAHLLDLIPPPFQYESSRCGSPPCTVYYAHGRVVVGRLGRTI